MRSPCPEFDLFRHVLITGGTGCGKTVSVVLPLLARALAQDANCENRKPALFLVDVKGDITASLRHMADINGRKNDIIEISAEAFQSTNLLANLARDPFTGSQLLTSATYQRLGFADIGKENAFWQVGTVGYVSSALAWLQFLAQPCTAANLDLILTGDARTGWEFSNGLKFPREQIESTVNCLRKSSDPSLNQLAILLSRIHELRIAEGRTRSSFVSVLAQVIEALAHPLSQLVTSNHATWTPESWLREGKILLVRLPFATEPGPSNFIVRLLKLSLYRTILSRFSSEVSPEMRPIFFFMDEAHRFVTTDPDTGDQYFVDRCRAMRAGCVYATQSIAALESVFDPKQLNNFLANINTRVFGRSLDIPTTSLASAILGDVDQIRDYSGARMILTPDPDPEAPPQPTLDPNFQNNRLIAASDLARLNIGEFFVANGADVYRWDAELDPNFECPTILGPSRTNPVPKWTEVQEMQAIRDTIAKANSPDAPSQPIPVTNLDDGEEKIPITDKNVASAPQSQAASQPPIASHEQEGLTGAIERPAWMSSKKPSTKDPKKTE